MFLILHSHGLDTDDTDRYDADAVVEKKPPLPAKVEAIVVAVTDLHR